MTPSEKTAVATSVATGFVSLSSLALSFLAFRRDQGRLDVSIGLYDEYRDTTLTRVSSVIEVKVVNSGRRPVILTGVGFNHRGN